MTTDNTRPTDLRQYDFGIGYPLLMHVYFEDCEYGIDLWLLDIKAGYSIFAWAYPDYDHIEWNQAEWTAFHNATCHTLEENHGAAWINTARIAAMYPTNPESDDVLQPPAPYATHHQA